jgi:hypothetical protein
MILVHPDNGYFIASYSSEVDDMRKLGWVPVDEKKEDLGPPLRDEPPPKQTKRRKNVNGT